jgi:hypothetical protein
LKKVKYHRPFCEEFPGVHKLHGRIPGEQTIDQRLFSRALKKFLNSPEDSLDPDKGILTDLILGWNNINYSAHDEYLRSCIYNSLKLNKSPILECGSGLTTILVGITLGRTGNTLWSLENSETWGERVRNILKKFNISSVNLNVKPLKDYGGYYWYDPPLDSMPDKFGLVICDGPPGNTIGGRYGLIPVMRARLTKGTLILLDDASRPDEQRITESWKQALNAKVEIAGIRKPFNKIIL